MQYASKTWSVLNKHHSDNGAENGVINVPLLTSQIGDVAAMQLAATLPPPIAGLSSCTGRPGISPEQPHHNRSRLDTA